MHQSPVRVPLFVGRQSWILDREVLTSFSHSALSLYWKSGMTSKTHFLEPAQFKDHVLQSSNRNSWETWRSYKCQHSGGSGRRIAMRSKPALSTKWILGPPGLHGKAVVDRTGLSGPSSQGILTCNKLFFFLCLFSISFFLKNHITVLPVV